MPDLTNYTGTPPTAAVMQLIDKLEAEGFAVAATTQGPSPGTNLTLRITWRGVYVGQMLQTMWLSPDPCLCMYRFPVEGRSGSKNAAPAGFDMSRFAAEQGCDVALLHLRTDASGSYLWIRDEASSLKLMRSWARRIDKDTPQ